MKEKSQIVVERVNEFFAQILTLKSSDMMRQYLEFCERAPNHAMFNNTLIFIQKPSCYYYATKSQWKKLFNREPKPLARPLLILFPFAPVEFVYDLEDTDGEPLPKNLIEWWTEERGGISNEKLDNLMNLCEELGIKTSVASINYLHERGNMTFGVAFRSENNERIIELHPRYKDPTMLQEAFGVLVHEVAHHLLGHLGEMRHRVDTKNDSREVIITKDGRHYDRGVREVEAELTAWLLFSKCGIPKKSAEYLAGWMTQQNVKYARVTEVCKVVENIHKMSEGKRWWVNKLPKSSSLTRT